MNIMNFTFINYEHSLVCIYFSIIIIKQLLLDIISDLDVIFTGHRTHKLPLKYSHLIIFFNRSSCLLELIHFVKNPDESNIVVVKLYSNILSSCLLLDF